MAPRGAGPGAQERPFDLMGMLDEPDWKGFRRLAPYPVQHNASLAFLTKSNFCGGFLFFRSSPAAWVMLDLLAMKLFQVGQDAPARRTSRPSWRCVMWEALQLQTPGSASAFCRSSCSSRAGCYFSDNKYGCWRQAFRRHYQRDSPVVVHNDWIVGRRGQRSSASSPRASGPGWPPRGRREEVLQGDWSTGSHQHVQSCKLGNEGLVRATD